MKNIKPYSEFIKEAVNNVVNTNYVLKSIAEFISRKHKIENFNIKGGLLTIQFNDEEYKAYFNDKALRNKIKSKYDNPYRTITFNNYVSGYGKVEIMIKDLYLKRIKPPKFIYHVSDKLNKESITKYGLLAKENSNGYGHVYDYDKPFVFASMYPNRLFMNNEDLDVWIIDTTLIDNKWYMDFNFSHHAPNHIITDKNIPPSALKRVSMEIFDKKYRNLKF